MAYRHFNSNNKNNNYGRQHRQDNRVDSEEDYCTYVTCLERKTSMIDGPHFGNMQHAFQRVEVYEEEVFEEEEEEVVEFETRGRFGRAKHMGQVTGNNKGRGNNNQQQCYEISKKNVKMIRA